MVSWVLFRAADFGTAAGIIQSLVGGNGLAFDWGDYGANPIILAVAAAVALIGPTSQDAVLNYRYGKPWIAVPAALAFVLLAIEVGSKAHIEFIYFQF